METNQVPKTRRLFEFCSFSLDASQKQLFQGREVVPLSPKVMDTLIVLVENCGRIVAKEEILRRVWPNTFVADTSLSQNISLLRKALGEDADMRFIETVPKRGYRFVAPVRLLNGEVPALTRQDSPSAKLEREAISQVEYTVSSSRKRKRYSLKIPAFFTDQRLTTRLALIGLSLMALTIITLLVNSKIRLLQGAPSEPPVKSIAVLPFKTIGMEEDKDVLGLGMADAIIFRLSKLAQPTVLPTSTIYKYNDSSRDAVAIGRDLSVDAVLEGTLQRSGDKVRATAQLIRVSDAKIIWANKFDEDYNSIFEAQDMISSRLAGTLAPKLSSGDKEKVAKGITQNPQAYDSYLMGLFLVSKGQESVIKSIPYFQKAIEQDPTFGLAYASLADGYYYNASTNCYLAKILKFEVTSPEESLKRAKDNIAKALAIDESIAKAHLVIAGIRTLEKDYSGAQSEYQHALELDPNSAEAHSRYGSFLFYMGAVKEAFYEKERGQTLDPTSLTGNASAANIAIFARQYDAAIKYASRALEIDPANATNRHALGDAYLFKSDYARAIDQFEKILASNAPKYCVGVARLKLAVAYMKVGRRSEAEALIRQSSHFKELDPETIASAYAALGDNDQAFELLEKVRLTRYWVAKLKFDPYLDTLRSDPRFSKLLQKPLLVDLI
jgi:DNA-binding winged helix-turn-helix (wHTH) protein/TolB-like protein/Tfp pilus assembly protein PilF